jgi:hypothetical protein
MDDFATLRSLMLNRYLASHAYSAAPTRPGIGRLAGLGATVVAVFLGVLVSMMIQ